GHVGIAAADPAGDHPDAQAENCGGAAVTTITAETQRRTPAATRPAERMRRVARRWRYLSNAGAALVSVVLLVWTITPLYNMVMVALEKEGDVSVTHIWPPERSAESFWVVLTEGHWHLEAVWHRFGNSVFLAAM